MTAPGRPLGASTARPLITDKVFSTLRARAALAGCQLFRSHLADGPPRLLLDHGSRVRQVGLDEIEAVVVATGGA